MVCYQMVTPNDVDQEHDINVLKQERGATVDVQDSSGNTALHLTCSGKTGCFAIFYVLSSRILSALAWSFKVLVMTRT